MSIKKNARSMKGAFSALLVWACLIGDVSAQILDDIILNKAPDGKVVATITLGGPVQYLRHFPDKRGQHLEIFFKQLLDGDSSDLWQGYEMRTSPPSDLIPRFTVEIRDLNIQPKMVVEFSRPTEYSVRVGENKRSFVITIQPDKTQAPSGKAEPVKKQQNTKNEARARQPEIKPKTGNVPTQVVDDIIFDKAPDGKIIATITLSGPVQYLRHIPDNNGQHLDIFFKQLLDGASGNLWQGYEMRTSPPSDLLPGFTVEVRDLNIQPRMVVKFSRPTKYSMHLGEDKRSFVIAIQPDKTQAASGKTEPAKEQQKAISEVPSPQPEMKVGVKEDSPTLPVTVQTAPDKSQAPSEKIETAKEQQSASNEAPSPQPEIKPEIKVDVKEGSSALPVTVQTAPENISPSVAATTAAPVAAEALSADQLKETDSQAEVLMEKGRDALKINEYGLAIEAFNKVLLLPPNKFSQDAQEWVGIARESAGQKFKAKLEYESYLKMYTSGVGVDRVKERLAKLSSVQPVRQAAEKTATPKEKKGFETISFGSLSMYYYHGESLTTVAGVASPATPVTDQSMLLTNVSASMRSRNDQYDNRIVFQDTYNKNLLTTTSQTSPNRLSAAYFDFKNKVTNFSSRIGRQSPSGGGIMGRFDGISAGYGFTQKWHATASAGSLSDFTLGSKPVFQGFGLGIGANERLSGSIYAVNQSIDGTSDRKAVGTELRYFDTNRNGFAILDYDTSFKAVNIALLQGTINGAPGTTYNFLVDHRKTPSISIRNALIGSSSTINTLLQNGWTRADLELLARLRTATANLVQFGVSQQIKEKWQAGVDVRVSNTSGLPQSGTQNPDGTTGLEGFTAATTGTGNEWGLTGQLIGNNVFSAHDVSVCSLSYSKGNTITGESFFLTNHLSLAEKWGTDASLRLYWQSDNLGGKETIITPTLRATYQAKDKLSFEVSGGIELTNNTPATGPSSKTTRKYFSLGLRSDF